MALETAIERASHEELRHILGWLESRTPKSGDIPGVLVGGWAVYSYNPYLGSIDIDLVTSARVRKSLTNWLVENRGFERHRTDEYGWDVVRKRTPEDQWVIADFGNRSEVYKFEGRGETLNFDILEGRVEYRRVENLKALVPERSLLVLFKLKAAYDRGTRLADARSPDPDWERGKRIKDLADVLALVDPDRGGNDFAVGFLGGQLERYPFLAEELRAAASERDAVARYGRLSPMEARRRVELLLSLLL